MKRMRRKRVKKRVTRKTISQIAIRMLMTLVRALSRRKGKRKWYLSLRIISYSTRRIQDIRIRDIIIEYIFSVCCYACFLCRQRVDCQWVWEASAIHQKSRVWRIFWSTWFSWDQRNTPRYIYLEEVLQFLWIFVSLLHVLTGE